MKTLHTTKRTLKETKANIAARKKNGTYVPMEEFIANARKQRWTWEKTQELGEQMLNGS